VCIFYLVNEVVSIGHTVSGSGHGLATDKLSTANTDLKGQRAGHDVGPDSQHQNGMFI